MKHRTLLKLCAGAALAFNGATAAMAQMYEKIRLANSTGYTISEIYISQSASNNWEEDVLDWDVLGHGQTLDVNMRRTANVCSWDLKVIYDDGEEVYWRRLNLCENWYFELYYNNRTGETTLQAE